MEILLSGASGFLGGAVHRHLVAEGNRVLSLVRRAPRSELERFWDVREGVCELKSEDNIEAVIHLAGESIADGYWTAAKKQRILDSRILSSRLLVSTLKHRARLPRVFLSASAIGFYGDSGQSVMTESSPQGSLFLSRVCEEWERECRGLEDVGVRSVQLRFGVILGPNGGALSKMLLAFRLGLGATLGSGRQILSWISLNDAVSAICCCVNKEKLQGPVNLVSPEPVTNREFTKTLGRALRRPAILHFPKFLLQIVMGEMAQEMLLSSCRAHPTKLLACGYQFQQPNLLPALEVALSN